MGDITEILSKIGQGDGVATEQLMPIVYEELKTLAAVKLNREKPGQTLQATALVHEAYLRLIDANDPQAWDNRRHFFAAAAEAMRRILVENARRKGRRKHGGESQREELRHVDVFSLPLGDEVLDLDEALNALDHKDGRAAELAKLRFFAGMTLEEAASSMGISLRTAKRDWTFARAWLGRALKAYDDPDA